MCILHVGGEFRSRQLVVHLPETGVRDAARRNVGVGGFVPPPRVLPAVTPAGRLVHYGEVSAAVTL